MKAIFLLAAVLSITVAGAQQPSAPAKHSKPQRITLELTSLTEGAKVGMRETVRGKSSSGQAMVWIIIKTPDNACWAHGPSKVDPNGDFRIPTQIGDGTSKGLQFIIRAVANPHVAIRPGEVDCLPETDGDSPEITVTRK